MLGEVVAGLQLASVHGETRAGEVFIGTCDDGQCAVKLLRRELCGERARVDRALATAKTVGAMDHRGIEFVIEAGWDGDHAYLLGDIIPGVQLAKLAGQRRLEPDYAIALLGLAADAIAAAHDIGVHHGALEPMLLLVGFASDRVVVRDFGLGELLADAAAAYRAPEPSAGAPGDVYALGQIALEPMPSRPARIEDLVRRMLAQDPTGRPSMSDVHAELTGKPRKKPALPLPPPPPAPPRAPDVAAVMLAVAAEANDEPTPAPGPPPEPAP